MYTDFLQASPCIPQDIRNDIFPDHWCSIQRHISVDVTRIRLYLQ